MKRAQRRAHMLIWWILLPLTLAGLVAAFTARREAPVLPDSEGLGTPAPLSARPLA